MSHEYRAGYQAGCQAGYQAGYQVGLASALLSTGHLIQRSTQPHSVPDGYYHGTFPFQYMGNTETPPNYQPTDTIPAYPASQPNHCETPIFAKGSSLNLSKLPAQDPESNLLLLVEASETIDQDIPLNDVPFDPNSSEISLHSNLNSRAVPNGDNLNTDSVRQESTHTSGPENCASNSNVPKEHPDPCSLHSSCEGEVVSSNTIIGSKETHLGKDDLSTSEACQIKDKPATSSSHSSSKLDAVSNTKKTTSKNTQSGKSDSSILETSRAEDRLETVTSSSDQAPGSVKTPKPITINLIEGEDSTVDALAAESLAGDIDGTNKPQQDDPILEAPSTTSEANVHESTFTGSKLVLSDQSHEVNTQKASDIVTTISPTQRKKPKASHKTPRDLASPVKRKAEKKLGRPPKKIQDSIPVRLTQIKLRSRSELNTIQPFIASWCRKEGAWIMETFQTFIQPTDYQLLGIEVSWQDNLKTWLSLESQSGKWEAADETWQRRITVNNDEVTKMMNNGGAGVGFVSILQD
jgi:hypothetical protein